MFTYNITFAADPSKESQLLQYISRTLLPKIFNENSPARNLQLKKVIEAGGEKPSSEDALSIALAADFESEEKAHLWNDHFLLPALNDFQEKFGTQALFFITLLEKIEL